MATVPTPFTATAGDKLSATTWNAQVRDVFNWLLTGFPRVHAFDATGNTCVATVGKLIQFDGETYDTDSMHDTAVNNSRIVFQTAGRYDIDVLIGMPAIGAYSQMDMHVRLNSGGSIAGGSAIRVQPFSDSIQAMPGLLFRAKRFMNAGDYIEVFILQNSSASRLTVALSTATRVQCEWLSTT